MIKEKFQILTKNLEELKKSIITNKTNELLNMYSNNHLSIKKNQTLINYQ